MSNNISNFKTAIKNHKSRKKIYFFISIFLLLLLISIFFVVRSEIIYADKSNLLKKNNSFIIKSEKEITDLNNKLYESKEKFYNYLLNSNTSNYREYFKSLDSLNKKLDYISSIESPLTNTYLGKKNYIDSLHRKNRKLFRYAPPKFNYHLKNLSIDSVTKIDSVKKKWFFGRLLDAILGRINVETVTTKISTIKEYNKDIKEDGLKANKKLEKSALLKKKRNITKFIDLNNKLVSSVESFLSTYIKDLNKFKRDNDLEHQNLNNTLIRNTRIISFSLLTLMASVIIILLYLAKSNFKNEKKLIIEQEINKQHLYFKNNIIRVFSHETKIPLSLISIFSHNLEKSISDNNNAKEVFASLKYSSKSLVDISKSVLRSSNHEQNKQHLKPFNLKNELENIFSVLNYFVNKNNNQLIIKSDIEQLDFYIKEDLSKLQQLFYNLIGNSNKNTQNGEISVFFNCDRDDEYLMIEFKIKDNGTGIHKKDLPKILLENYIGKNNQDKEDSTGLGLYLTKKIIQNLNGKISIESTKNIGTSLIFSINLKIN